MTRGEARSLTDRDGSSTVTTASSTGLEHNTTRSAVNPIGLHTRPYRCGTVMDGTGWNARQAAWRQPVASRHGGVVRDMSERGRGRKQTKGRRERKGKRKKRHTTTSNRGTRGRGFALVGVVRSERQERFQGENGWRSMGLRREPEAGLLEAGEIGSALERDSSGFLSLVSASLLADTPTDRQTRGSCRRRILEYTGIRFLQPVTAEEGASQHGIQRQAVYEDAGCL